MMLSMRRWGCRRNGFSWLILVAMFFPSLVVLMVVMSIPGADQADNEQQVLDGRLYDLQAEIDHLRLLDKQKQKAFLDLQTQMQFILEHAEHIGSNMTILSKEQSMALIANLSHSASALAIPNLFDHLPHLLRQDAAGLQPAIRIARKPKRSAHLVIGIPTIKRPKVNYLMTTLRSLVDNLSPDEQEEVTIVVFIGEMGTTEYASEQVTLLEAEFPDAIRSGVIEIIVPPAHFYPDLTKIPPTFDDTPERMIWRTKQNLDYAYLMMYCQNKATYYMQLEDDVITKPGYLANIKNFTSKQTTVNANWVLLEFSSLGFIGKLFKSADLPLVINFILLFHKEKPVDWLLDHILYTKVCHPEKTPKQCQQVKNLYRIRQKPSLFQHIGVQSSLKGKTQKLKEKDFGKLPMHRAHTNPSASVSTSLKVYQKYGLEEAYKGDNYFWGLLPQAGDWVKIEFTPPVRIQSFVFRSGNAEHPDDMFANTTVEIQPDNPQDFANYQMTEDGYAVVAQFSASGRADATLNTTGTGCSSRMKVLPKSGWSTNSSVQ